MLVIRKTTLDIKTFKYIFYQLFLKSRMINGFEFFKVAKDADQFAKDAKQFANDAKLSSKTLLKLSKTLNWICKFIQIEF